MLQISFGVFANYVIIANQSHMRVHIINFLKNFLQRNLKKRENVMFFFECAERKRVAIKIREFFDSIHILICRSFLSCFSGPVFAAAIFAGERPATGRASPSPGRELPRPAKIPTGFHGRRGRMFREYCLIIFLFRFVVWFFCSLYHIILRRGTQLYFIFSSPICKKKFKFASKNYLIEKKIVSNEVLNPWPFSHRADAPLGYLEKIHRAFSSCQFERQYKKNRPFASKF